MPLGLSLEREEEQAVPVKVIVRTPALVGCVMSFSHSSMQNDGGGLPQDWAGANDITYSTPGKRIERNDRERASVLAP